jgi:hypothetical protein
MSWCGFQRGVRLSRIFGTIWIRLSAGSRS